MRIGVIAALAVGLSLTQAVPAPAETAPTTNPAPAGQITTVAGTGTGIGTPGYNGDNGDNQPATAAQLDIPTAVAVNGAGDLYIAEPEKRRVRRVDHASGQITTVARTGRPGDNSDNPPAATNDELEGVAVNAAGDLYIAYYNSVRQVDHASGQITTVAGTGMPGQNGDTGDDLDNQPATSARIDARGGVAVNAAGDLYIAGSGGVRRVDHASGQITTVAGTGGSGGYNGDNEPHVYFPTAVAVNGAGDLYIADVAEPGSVRNRVRRVDHASGQITTVAGTGEAGYNGDNQPASAAQLSNPKGVAVNAAGDLYIADAAGPGGAGNRVRRVDHASGQITTVAGTGEAGYNGDNQPASAAQLNNPYAVAVNATGDLYIADTGNDRVRKVSGGASPPVPSSGGGAGTSVESACVRVAGPPSPSLPKCSAYQSRVVADRPSAYYPLDGVGTGVAFDLSGNENDGRYRGPAAGTTDVHVHGDASARLPAGGAIIAPYDPGTHKGVAAGASYSVEMWFALPACPLQYTGGSCDTQRLWTAGGIDGVELALTGDFLRRPDETRDYQPARPWINSAGLTLQFPDVHEGIYLPSLYLADGIWHQIAFSVDPAGVTIVVDGQQPPGFVADFANRTPELRPQGSSPTNLFWSSPSPSPQPLKLARPPTDSSAPGGFSPVVLGGDASGSGITGFGQVNPFDGYMSDFAFYDHTVDPGAFQQHYATDPPRIALTPPMTISRTCNGSGASITAEDTGLEHPGNAPQLNVTTDASGTASISWQTFEAPPGSGKQVIHITGFSMTPPKDGGLQIEETFVAESGPATKITHIPSIKADQGPNLGPVRVPLALSFYEPTGEWFSVSPHAHYEAFMKLTTAVSDGLSLDLILSVIGITRGGCTLAKWPG